MKEKSGPLRLAIDTDGRRDVSALVFDDEDAAREEVRAEALLHAADGWHVTHVPNGVVARKGSILRRITITTEEADGR